MHNLPPRGRPIPRRGLAKLLGGLNVANSGTVSWNGSDIQQMDDLSVREHVAFVFQDYTRFFFSAAENIGFGRWQHAHDREAVTEAARDAGAVDFLEVFPAGIRHASCPPARTAGLMCDCVGTQHVLESPKSVAESGRFRYGQIIIAGQETFMEYTTPTLKRFGTLSSLTLGNNGSCPDGNNNATQKGGMSGCGVSGP